jgi:hypothetical protein
MDLALHQMLFSYLQSHRRCNDHYNWSNFDFLSSNRQRGRVVMACDSRYFFFPYYMGAFSLWKQRGFESHRCHHLFAILFYSTFFVSNYKRFVPFRIFSTFCTFLGASFSRTFPSSSKGPPNTVEALFYTSIPAPRREYDAGCSLHAIPDILSMCFLTPDICLFY